MRTAEAWAQSRGATVMHMGAWHEDLERFYERLGYAKYETIYAKALKALEKTT